MTKGKFIVFEGADASGKSSQISIQSTMLKIKFPSKDFVFTREPGSYLKNQCDKIRGTLLNEEKVPLVAEALLYAADRAIHVEAIKELLDKGINVFCDRYFYSSIVYQSYAGGIPIDDMYTLCSLAIEGLVPDACLIFNVSEETQKERKNIRGTSDKIEDRGDDYSRKVREGYQNLIANLENDERHDLLPKKVFHIDGDKSIEETGKQVSAILLDIL